MRLFKCKASWQMKSRGGTGNLHRSLISFSPNWFYVGLNWYKEPCTTFLHFTRLVQRGLEMLPGTGFVLTPWKVVKAEYCESQQMIVLSSVRYEKYPCFLKYQGWERGVIGSGGKCNARNAFCNGWLCILTFSTFLSSWCSGSALLAFFLSF